jgi:hypothetical protein
MYSDEIVVGHKNPNALTFSKFNKNGTKSAKDIQCKFKNIPNLQIRGTTFDVRHLDQFI